MRSKPISPSLNQELPTEPLPAFPQGLSLRKNFTWTIFGNVVYSGCQWGMLVILAKLGSPEMVGQFVLGLAVTAPIFMFSNLQLRAVQATDARREYLFGHYLALRLTTIVMSLLIIGGITGLSSYHWDTKLVIMAVGLAKAFEALSDVFYGLFQQNERLDRIAISMIIKGPLSLATLGLVFYFTGSVFWCVLGLAVAWAMVLLGYDAYRGAQILAVSDNLRSIPPGGVRRRLVFKCPWEIATLGHLAWLAFPLGFVMMVISLKTNIPRYFIEHYLGERELGIFAAMAYFMMAGNQVVTALGHSASPRMAKYYAAGRKKALSTLLKKLMLLGCLLGLVGVFVALWAGKEILTLIYRPEYAEQAGVLAWLMVTASIYYVGVFLGYGMTAARYFRIQAPLNASTLLLIIGASALLIPRYGLLGAAWVACLVHTVEIPLKAWIMAHAFKNIPVNSSG
ncbi:MAG: oligosaccharide flippase family protein [Desulfobacteraceae bacterium]